MKIRRIMLFIFCTFALCLLAYASSKIDVYAYSGSAGDYDHECVNYCTSWAAGWHRQDLSTFVSWSYDSTATLGKDSDGQPNDKGAIAALCNGIGATEIYRLSFERAKVAHRPGMGFEAGKFSGLLDVNTGQSIYESGLDGVEKWSDVYETFELAAAHGGTNTSWNNTAWFCWNEEWRCPPDDPTCGPVTPDPDSGDGYFQSKSSIEAAPGNDIPSGIKAETDWDGTGEIKYSTDQDTVTVNFVHILRYENKNIPSHSQHCDNGHCHNDEYDDAETDYKVVTSINGGTSEAASGSYSSPANVSQQESKYTGSVSVRLDQGETKTVCQTISYADKNFTFTVTDKDESGDDGTILHPDPWSYTWHKYEDPSGSGSGSSRVCATITRPGGPDTGDGTGGTGSTSSNVMFAGETADISWNVSGGSVDTRRLREWQAVVYRVNVNVLNSSSLYTGTRGNLQGSQSLNVCQWYSNHDYCNVLGGRSGSFGSSGQSHSYNESANIVVPDQVGYKYCNSFGYRYEYWWYSSSSGGDGWNFDKSYWRIQDASCRTIAKKPTVTIWNSNMMTAGGITTSSSPRFDNPIMGTESSAGGSKTLYGAWVEHLAAIGRNVTYFGSGSSFAIGSKNLAAPKSSPLTLDNSTLTISNNGKLGSSGIFNNSTYRTRLTTFLENQATRPGGSELGAMSNVSDTRILRYDGNLKITGNITTAPGPYNSIYHVPQVVIFVHGDLEIASDVTRIDAWLIVDGKINTCSEFQSGLTEADAISRLRDTCNKQLVFNGPVLANNLVLTRSFGADPLITRTGTFGTASTRQAAGEVFNLRADTYLWAYAQAGRYDSSYTESYTRELAPRY